ncbi:hypothetical protein AMATHDRAFT_139436 [Amanita thiersii Skay4041]|uniref:IMD domain-containing protein n=1 Tax=Amanita thiersii Skay4041 TaxID=703135 RepID=A0A2A9NXT8_9AGAR|nr:hypothetical protein AMATHDRAFT_139436 [Amanita thiersii Skay4041]
MTSITPRSLRALALNLIRRDTSPSPAFSDATHAFAINFGSGSPGKIITRSNLKSSIQALEDLIHTCANYRVALMTMSKVTANFADVMARCSGLKGPSYEASTRLQAASGVHHLIGNQWHILAEVLEKNFERPLRQHLDSYRTIVVERSTCYERALREKSQLIRTTEARSMNRKERNLQSFREALAILQQQVDELDELRAAHYREILEHEGKVWDTVQGKVCVVVRSTMDIFDRFTAKASDPVIEPMLQSIPDPFDSYGPPQSEDQIFSILAPLSMTAVQQSATPSPLAVTPECEPVEVPEPPSNSRMRTWISNTNTATLLPTNSSLLSSSASTSSPTVQQAIPSGSENSSGARLHSHLSVFDESYPRVEDIDSAPSSSNRTSLALTASVKKFEGLEDLHEPEWPSLNHSQYANTTSYNDEGSRPDTSSPPPSALPPVTPPVLDIDHSAAGNSFHTLDHL